ncbi:uncharacterized protein LOC114938654 [Nylanderia fulva]|uniref:uncharacterized protein LOC114938654 n=1 Tax=Nylanderia fulva TaxID=613905 RepID=UPI0010FAE260|nr:uncharacterized protein LOC114938654 [Nylanderia fulva]
MFQHSSLSIHPKTISLGSLALMWLAVININVVNRTFPFSSMVFTIMVFISVVNFNDVADLNRWSLKGEKSEHATEMTSTNSNVMLNGSGHIQSFEVEKQVHLL